MNIPGQSVAVAELRIQLLVNQLMVVNGLDTKHIKWVLDGLTKCSCEDFKTLYNVEKLSHVKGEITFDIDTTMTYSSTDQAGIAKAILAHLSSAKALYLSLCAKNQWTDAGGAPFSYNKLETTVDPPRSGNGTFTIECFNCGGAHHLTECPKDRHEPTIKANRKKFHEAKDARAAQRAAPNGGNTPPTIPRRDSAGNTAPSFRLNAKGLVDFKCTTCRKKKGANGWTNHPTSLHKVAIKDPNFCYWKKRPKCNAGQLARQCAARVASESDSTPSSSPLDADAQQALWNKVNSLGADTPEGKAALNALRLLSASDF